MRDYFLFTASSSGQSASSRAMVLLRTGCTNSGAISAIGVITNLRFCIRGCGTFRSGRSMISRLNRMISISMIRGPYFSPRNRPIFCSMASKDFSSSRAFRAVSSSRAWFRKSGWSVFPQADVSNTDDCLTMVPQPPEIKTLVLSRFSNLSPILPPISKYARFIERNIRRWPNIIILPLKPVYT